jgi:hypothetical protein
MAIPRSRVGARWGRIAIKTADGGTALTRSRAGGKKSI